MSDFTVGDTTPALTGTTGTNLAGATIELHLSKPDSTVITKKDTDGLELTDPTTGAWSCPWADGDLDQPGTWRVELQVTYSGGGTQSFNRTAAGDYVTFGVVPQAA